MVVETSRLLFENHLYNQDVFHFGGREAWRALCENVLTKRTSFRFAVERSGVLFDIKDVFNSAVEESGVLFGKHLSDEKYEF